MKTFKKYNNTYARILSECVASKNCFNKNLIKEQFDDQKFKMILFIQDPASNDRNDNYDPNNFKFSSTYLDMIKYGGTTDFIAHDMSERSGKNEGNLCFYFNFDEISKNDIFNLMTTSSDENFGLSYLNILDDQLSQQDYSDALSDADSLITVLKKAIDSNSVGVVDLIEL